jgi:hypothetical protein
MLVITHILFGIANASILQDVATQIADGFSLRWTAAKAKPAWGTKSKLPKDAFNKACCH